MTQATVTKRERTCISCGAKSDKLTLMRIVRRADGSVESDPTGRIPGRGAYVCSVDCLTKALASRKLQRALKTNVTDDDAERIASAVRSAAIEASIR